MRRQLSQSTQPDEPGESDESELSDMPILTPDAGQDDRGEPSKQMQMVTSLAEFYSRHTLLIWLAVILVPIIIITIGCIVLPEIFYDQFVWRYFWGTIEADAQEESYGEVTEAYNPVNTIFYSVIVIIILFWIYKYLKKYEVKVDTKFFMAIIPFILIGGIARALEDAELFMSPIVYLFIAPIIYIFIGIAVLCLIQLGVVMRRVAVQKGVENALILAAVVFVCLDAGYLFTYFYLNHQFSYILHPIVPVIISIFVILGFGSYTITKNRFDVSIFLLSVGLWLLMINLMVLFQWQSISSWTEAYLTANPGADIQLQPRAFVLAGALAVAATAILYLTAAGLSTKFNKVKAFMLSTNIMLFFGHFLDASATYVAIDFFGYAEKHVLPTFLIEVFQTAAVMVVLKAVLIILVVYFIDILLKKDLHENPTFFGLVKVAVLVLGLAPGTRDILRLAIGV